MLEHFPNVSVSSVVELLFCKNQASICKTVRRMISVVLWVATLVGFLLVFGVNLNTVLVSGAASISALVVALSKYRLLSRLDCL